MPTEVWAIPLLVFGMVMALVVPIALFLVFLDWLGRR